MEYEKVFKKISNNIKEYEYLTLIEDYPAHHLKNYSFTLCACYNKRFSNNINIIIKNQSGRDLDNFTVNIKDLDWLKDKIKGLY